MRQLFTISILLVLLTGSALKAQHSVARQWNEILLEAIRNDLARPTIHARNLFHISAAMYDAWAAYEPGHSTWLLGQWHRNFYCPFEGVPAPQNLSAAREEAISYAAFNLILHRFQLSPGAQSTFQNAYDLMDALGYDTEINDVDYKTGSAAALGNYIAGNMIQLGLQDGAFEEEEYRNQFYEPLNPPLLPTDPGNPFILDPNRWQPLFLDTFIDQSGNPIPFGQIEFQSPEWGQVLPFALKNSDLDIYERDSNAYWVYHDPGPPPLLEEDGGGLSQEYMWGFALVSVWGAHLDHNDGVMWDISPGALGNTPSLPETMEGLRDFYKLEEGGDPGTGHTLNPHTGEPYAPNIVPRGDYARVLAEFWADGPESETPPGHWFVILNYVNDHPEFEKRFKGEGPVLDDLEWDVKAYFTLGGAVHDAAVAAWGIKGWYDYVRPISAIRYMADQGQSTDPGLPNYSPEGIPLVEGYVELIEEGDPLEGQEGEFVGEIKLYTWRGPAYIEDPDTDFAGVGWIRAAHWWPYQRPTFVTPPFAGYVSGHSTFSRAAAEVMTLLTGDPYFPGGMGEFLAEANRFLVFEEGPSVDVALQWATYRDASDQTSLSRIWGGIHPPADDIPGRRIGIEVGTDAFDMAELYFTGLITSLEEEIPADDGIVVYPIPVSSGQDIYIKQLNDHGPYEVQVVDASGRQVTKLKLNQSEFVLSTQGWSPGIYLLNLRDGASSYAKRLIIQ